MNQTISNFSAPGIVVKRYTEFDRRLMLDPTRYKGDTVVLRCVPLVITVLQSQRKQICNYCMKQKQLSRCTQCQVYYYCSKECQQIDWRQHHKKECLFVKHLSTKTKIIPSNILMLTRIYFNDLDLYDFYGDILRLTDQQKDQYNDTALLLISHKLQMEGKSLENDQNLEAIGNLMAIQSKMQFNAFTVTHSTNGNEIGIALYHPANFIDHRCSYIREMNNPQAECANCIVYFQERELIVFKNDLLTVSGDKLIELNISYSNTSNRQQFLQEQYGFICTCSRCVYEKSFHSKQRDLKFSVKNKIEATMDQQQKLKTLANQYVSLPLAETFQQLRKFVEEFEDERFYQPIESSYLELLSAQNHKEAYRVLKHLLKGIPMWLASKEHPFLALKLNEASKLAFHLNYLTQAEEHSVAAIKMFRVFSNTPEQIDEYKELLQRLNDIQSEIKMNK